MVYLLQGLRQKDKISLVKADNEGEVNSLFRFSDDTEIVGRLTDNEVNVLNTSSFVVVEA